MKLTRLYNYIDKMVKQCLHGKLIITFQRGRIIDIETRQHAKPDEI
jgi:hypothetical protein